MASTIVQIRLVWCCIFKIVRRDLLIRPHGEEWWLVIGQCDWPAVRLSDDRVDYSLNTYYELVQLYYY
jgi:hypothetical protein